MPNFPWNGIVKKIIVVHVVGMRVSVYLTLVKKVKKNKRLLQTTPPVLTSLCIVWLTYLIIVWAYLVEHKGGGVSSLTNF